MLSSYLLNLCYCSCFIEGKQKTKFPSYSFYQLMLAMLTGLLSVPILLDTVQTISLTQFVVILRNLCQITFKNFILYNLAFSLPRPLSVNASLQAYQVLESTLTLASKACQLHNRLHHFCCFHLSFFQMFLSCNS